MNEAFNTLLLLLTAGLFCLTVRMNHVITLIKFLQVFWFLVSAAKISKVKKLYLIPLNNIDTPLYTSYSVLSSSGEMRERLNRAVSKTVELARAPRVRIPLSPKAGNFFNVNKFLN